MRDITFTPDEYYHAFSRGNNKQLIFINKRDYARFLFLVLFFQSPMPIFNVSRSIDHFLKYGFFNISQKKTREIINTRMVELISFSLMPNHFHLSLYESEENGISRYMQRIKDSHAKYINIKYGLSGHLFQGPFKAVHIENNNQLLYLSSYIHRNSRELKGWKNKEHLYPWSSYQDYVGKNRWGELLKPEIILEQFKNTEEYRQFTKNSVAKEENILIPEHFQN